MNNTISREQAEQIFAAHSEFVYRTALLLTKSEALADDITQETFIQVFKKFHTFDSNRAIQPWIYKITINTTRNLLRKQKWLTFTGFAPDTCKQDSFENMIVREEANRELYEEINRLSFKSKEIIILHFYTGLKLSEIAEALDIPIGTSKSRLNYALNQLRKRFPEDKSISFQNGGEAYEIN